MLLPNPTRLALATVRAIVLSSALMITPERAFAATEVQGDAAAMQLRTENASIGEILKALGGVFKLTYKLSPNVGRTVSGDYTGNLRQVLARILDGNNYIIHEFDGTTEVIVLGPAGATTVVAIDPATAPPVLETVTPLPQESVSKAVPSLASFR